MKDHLEDFIRQHKNSFDDKEPPAKAWTAIERSLRFSGKSLWNSVALWRTAAAVFIALSVYLLLPGAKVFPKNYTAMKEFNDVEAFYTAQISQKVELIGDLQHIDGHSDFTHDLRQMEAMYLVLKEEMTNRPSQKVKDALVLNLLVRIDLLNQQLHKLEQKYKSEKKEKPGTNI